MVEVGVALLGAVLGPAVGRLGRGVRRGWEGRFCLAMVVSAGAMVVPVVVRVDVSLVVLVAIVGVVVGWR